eukprot:5514191-Pleurochrysis_carterae.AAC.2
MATLPHRARKHGGLAAKSAVVRRSWGRARGYGSGAMSLGYSAWGGGPFGDLLQLDLEGVGQVGPGCVKQLSPGSCAS